MNSSSYGAFSLIMIADVLLEVIIMEIIRRLSETEIDFSDYEKLEEIRKYFDSELKTLFSKEEYTVQIFECILIESQQIVIPFIDFLLSKTTFSKVAELQEAFPYIKEQFEKESIRPFERIHKFIEMCNYTGLIVGENEEEICTFDEYEEIQLSWSDEQESFNTYEMSIADIGFNLFSQFYDFLCHFSFENSEFTKEQTAELCIRQIDIILFDILWYMDDKNSTLENYTSQFEEALIKLMKII